MLPVPIVQAIAPEEPVAPLVEAIRQGRALSSEFFAISPTTMFRVAVTPQRLREIYDVRSSGSEAAGRPGRASSLVAALQRSQVALLSRGASQTRALAGGIDVRYGLAVSDEAGRPVFWICTNAAGDRAIIGSRVYRLTEPASAWFRSEGSRLLALKHAGKRI